MCREGKHYKITCNIPHKLISVNQIEKIKKQINGKYYFGYIDKAIFNFTS